MGDGSAGDSGGGTQAAYRQTDRHTVREAMTCQRIQLLGGPLGPELSPSSDAPRGQQSQWAHLHGPASSVLVGAP